MSGFVKFRFNQGAKNTACMVLDYDKFCKLPIEDLSKLLPGSESMKMKRLEVSDVYPTVLEAMDHEFFSVWNAGLDRRKFT